MILAPPLIAPFAQAVGITAGGMGMIELTKRVSNYIRTNPEKSKEIIKLISPSAAGISTLFENKKREEDNNLPSPIKEEKTPQQEPPEGEPDLLPELTKQTVEEAIRKEIKEKEPLNKIQTWEKYFDSKDEAEQVAKENNITLRDLEIPAIKKQITFRKHTFGYDIFFDKKQVGELIDITQDLKDSGNQAGNKKTFNLVFLDKDGSNQQDVITTIDGVNFAKEDSKDIVAKDLLRDSTEINYPSLKEIFQNLEYNNQGRPKKFSERVEKERESIEKLKREEKSMGGLIDKPLTGRSRDI